ncbi:hypothetical protein BDR03DRAFT_261569 [Suillus americanus]|nr:hypothetical protein BDR03DRAFT_261569 [Suillus americanus]
MFLLDEFSTIAASTELLLAFLVPLKICTKSAHLNIDTVSSVVYLDLLLSSLAEHFNPNVLESLDVGVGRPTDPSNHVLFELAASAFRNIRGFTKLTNLNLSSMHVSITDGEVLDLLSAWPTMEHLYFDTTWDNVGLGSCPLESDVSWACGCRCLNLRSDRPRPRPISPITVTCQLRYPKPSTYDSQNSI